MGKILYLFEMMNGADGISDIEGKATRVEANERGQRTSFNGADGISDIEGKATRVEANERGQRTSFNGADGISDIEGKATRVGASERGQRTSFKTVILFSVAALSCIPCLAKAQSADERLRAIYTEEWKWRLEQFPGLEGVVKPVPDRLPRVDPKTQETRLRYWQDVLHKLDDVLRTQLSPEEQIDYDVYRPEIENFVADQKFRDYERH